MGLFEEAVQLALEVRRLEYLYITCLLWSYCHLSLSVRYLVVCLSICPLSSCLFVCLCVCLLSSCLSVCVSVHV